MIFNQFEAFLAEKGYDADTIREEISSANIEAVISILSNRRQSIPYDKGKYECRNQIERLFNKLKNGRRVATRYNKTKDPISISLQSLKLNYGYPLLRSLTQKRIYTQG
jgi:transposase